MILLQFILEFLLKLDIELGQEGKGILRLVARWGDTHVDCGSIIAIEDMERIVVQA